MPPRKVTITRLEKRNLIIVSVVYDSLDTARRITVALYTIAASARHPVCLVQKHEVLIIHNLCTGK